MKSFSTRIVRTWEPSAWVRGLMIVLLLGSAAILFIFDVQDQTIKTGAKVTYAISMFSALGLSFLKPKNMGELDISEEEVKIVLKNDILRFPTAEIQEINFNDRGYADLWKHALFGNKNHLYFMTNSGEKFDYQIAIQSIQKKKELSTFLNELRPSGSAKKENRKNLSF